MGRVKLPPRCQVVIMSITCQSPSLCLYRGGYLWLWLNQQSAYLQRVMLQLVHSHCRWLPVPLVQSVPAGGLRGSLPGVHESMDLVRCIGGQPIAATLLVASKISLRLLWWPPTEHQCVLIYRCVFTHVCCWLFSEGNKMTTTTTTILPGTNLMYVYGDW